MYSCSIFFGESTEFQPNPANLLVFRQPMQADCRLFLPNLINWDSALFNCTNRHFWNEIPLAKKNHQLILLSRNYVNKRYHVITFSFFFIFRATRDKQSVCTSHHFTFTKTITSHCHTCMDYIECNQPTDSYWQGCHMFLLKVCMQYF